MQNDKYEKLKVELTKFPFLECEIENGIITIRGIWPVYGETSLIDNYSIKIVIPDDYPDSVPKVYELEGKIPRTPDRHINSDGSCCLFAPPERWEQWPLGAGIDVLLNGAVKSYFFSQTYFDLEKVWPFGEWLHDIAGIIQFYLVRLNLRTIQDIKRLMIVIDKKNVPKNWNCPCGSKKLYLHCHKSRVEKLKDILPEDEWKILTQIVSNQHWLG